MPDIHPQRNADVKATLLPDGHVVLFSTKTDWAQILNPTAAIVWEFCDGEHTPGEISAEVSKLLDVTDDSILVGHVEALVTELIDAGLLA